MWAYWVMFAVPSIAALAAGASRSPRSTARGPASYSAAWTAVFLALSVLIGFRFEVGGDWFNYIAQLDRVRNRDLADVLAMRDPGYQLLNWLSLELELGILGVNVLAGVLFSWGLVVFCRRLPRPWLALAVAVPYLVIVVAMGYTRQGIALGLALLGLAALGRGRTLPFVAWVVLGATFHRSAVLLLPIAAMTTTRNRYWTAFWVAVAALGAYVLLLEETADVLYQTYVEGRYQSEGAAIRLLMNAVPALVLVIWRTRFAFDPTERRLWSWFTVTSLALLPLLFVTRATTAIDRMALYALPLQLVVFSHFPDVLGARRRANKVLAGGVVLYYAAVEFVWLNYANHAAAWLPYRLFLPGGAP